MMHLINCQFLPSNYNWTFIELNVQLSKGTLRRNRAKTIKLIQYPGPVFTKGLRLSQVLGLNVVLKLRLLSQKSKIIK